MKDTIWGRACRKLHLFAAAALMLLFAAGAAPAAQAAIGDVYNINVPGTMQYTQAWSLLSSVNKLREEKKLDTLAMDDVLMTSAMQRAVELSCFYNHELRPNLTDATAINNKVDAATGFRGSATAAEAGKIIEGSEAITSLITNGEYKSIGIGCFEGSERYYWVLLLSKSAGSPAAHSDVTGNFTVTVTELGRLNQPLVYIGQQQTKEVSLYASEKTGVSVFWKDASFGSLRNATTTAIDPKTFTWKSSDKKIATISSTGTITAKGVGTATITAVPKVKQGTVEGVSLKVTVLANTFTAKLSGTSSSYAWTGKAIQPGVTVQKDTTTLVKGSDYTLTYKKNTSVGTGTVTVKGIGEFAGQQQVLSFKIVPSKVKSLKAVSSKAGQLRLSWAQNSQADGYQIQLATTSDMKANRVTREVAASALKVTVKGLENETQYYVRVRAYKTVSGTKIYGKWSSKAKEIVE